MVADDYLVTDHGVVFVPPNRQGKRDSVEDMWYQSVFDWDDKSLLSVLQSLEWQIERLSNRAAYVRTLLDLDGVEVKESPSPPPSLLERTLFEVERARKRKQ